MANIFENIQDKDRTKLLKNLEANTFKLSKNEMFFSQITRLEFENNIFILLDGFIQIIKNDTKGIRTILGEIFSNEIFGYHISSIDDSCEIVIKKDSNIIMIDADKIRNNMEVCSYNMIFLQNLFSSLNSIIETRNMHIKILSNRGIRNKLLDYFEYLYKKNRNKTFLLPFSITDLADILAVDRSAMSRELKNLKEDKIIELKNKKITLLRK